MNQITINQQIKEAVKLYNEDNLADCEELCIKMMEGINKLFGEPSLAGERELVLCNDDEGELEYPEPSLYDIIKDMKTEAYRDYVEEEGVFHCLWNVINYWHSCCLLRYFETVTDIEKCMGAYDDGNYGGKE